MTMNVLLVDDNPGDVLLTQEAVARSATDTELAVAVDGTSALAYLRGHGEHAGRTRPDLVLLDLNLPDIHGHDVLAAMKSDPILKATPVLVLSSSSLPADIREAYESHANTYITKPSALRDYDNVVSVIRSYWDGIAELPPGDA
jgi:CheY-like chemotaxis protein